MGGYTKNVAIVKGIKDGFSADGGELSGLVRAQKYGSELKIEVSLINFAPPSEGRYVAAITDGVRCEIIENCLFEGQSEVDTKDGFAAAIFYVHGGVSLVATAVCGNFAGDVFALKEAVERAERVKENLGEASFSYDDDAIAEVNYYEFPKTYKDGESVLENPPQKEADGGGENEADTRPVQKEERKSGLAGGDFYQRMSKEIEELLSNYPPEESLNSAIEGSAFVKISYGDGRFYVFGIIRDGKKPAYICYGVPAENPASPPESMKNISSFLPVPSGNFKGFWMIYQDAATGATIKVGAV